jgi:hypothetical protein
MRVVLLPLKWESHSAPEYGRRPQETINLQVADHCDMAIGIFWTRIGSPTGEYDSGTIEEIERAASEQKKVLLYFSSAQANPDDIDLEQLRKLREFKKKTFENALVSNYKNIIDFKEKLSTHLDIQVKSLMTEVSDGNVPIKFSPNINFQLASVGDGAPLGSEISLLTEYSNWENRDKIPDYFDPKIGQEAEKDIFAEKANKDYYRQVIDFLSIKRYFQTFRLFFENDGGLGARDVFVQFTFSSTDTEFTLIDESEIPKLEPKKLIGGLLSSGGKTDYSAELTNVGRIWNLEIELDALQPQRRLSPRRIFAIGAKSSCKIEILAKIYADTISTPILKKVFINLAVEKSNHDAAGIDYRKSSFINSILK